MKRARRTRAPLAMIPHHQVRRRVAATDGAGGATDEALATGGAQKRRAGENRGPALPTRAPVAPLGWLADSNRAGWLENARWKNESVFQNSVMKNFPGAAILKS